MGRSIAGAAIVAVGLVLGLVYWSEFLNIPSLFITVGGAVTVTSFSYSKDQVRGLMRTLTEYFSERRQTRQDHLEVIKHLTRLYRVKGIRGLENRENQLADPFLKQGVKMLVDLQKEEKIRAKLELEMAAFFTQQEVARQILFTLGKLLPAFGLIGTLIGLVLLLRDFSAQAPQDLTAALSLAVLTTLYGAVFANVIVLPLAARLQSVAIEKEMLMRISLDWVMILAQREFPATIAQRLTSLLLSADNDTNQNRDWGTFVLSLQR